MSSDRTRRSMIALTGTVTLAAIGLGNGLAKSRDRTNLPLTFGEINDGGEWLVLHNEGESTADISGLVIDYEFNGSQDQSKEFQEAFGATSIESGGSITVSTGAPASQGSNSADDPDVEFDFSTAKMADDDSDTYAILTPEGSVIARNDTDRHKTGQKSDGKRTDRMRTMDWEGQGSENATQDCEDSEQGFWHWILTPGGSSPLEVDGAELTVEFEDNTMMTVDGFRPGEGGGAIHFEVTKDGGGTVTSAEVTFSGGGDNPVLTISDGRCEEMGDPEEFEDLTVTKRCVNGNGTITVSNSNDVSVSVTVSGPDAYEEEKEVPAGGSIEYSGLANGTYDLKTDHEEIGLDQSSVVIDY